MIPTPLPGPQQGETPASFPHLRMLEARLHGDPFTMSTILHSRRRTARLLFASVSLSPRWTHHPSVVHTGVSLNFHPP